MVLGSQEDNSIALLDERRKELCLKGWRRNDLLRFGKYEEAISGITQGGPNAGDPITELQIRPRHRPLLPQRLSYL